jgi:penicillin-insensitive murein DD-endopeptidase
MGSAIDRFSNRRSSLAPGNILLRITRTWFQPTLRACLTVVTLSFVGALVTAEVFANPWARTAGPAPGAAKAFGKYTAGCVQGAVALDADAEGMQIMRPQRRRYFGHPNLVLFIQELAAHGREAGWGDVLVGDLSMPRGGPTLTNHVSHQSGLDADVWFLTSDQRLSVKQRETVAATEYVRWREKRLVSAWGEAQDAMIRFAAEYPDVERVFVSPVIKRHLCANATGKRTWLAKVRPWYGHGDHMHVRLRCPHDSLACMKQAAVATGDGCGKDLEWWFKPRKPSKSRNTKQRAPKLPRACASVLTAN